MDISSVTTSVCKSLRSIGLPKQEEHVIENLLIRQLTSSGPEFVLSRLSELKDWRKMHMRGDTLYHPEWHRYRTKKGSSVPTSHLESLLWKHNDKAFFAVVGSIQKSIELSIPTEKQLRKWIDAVRCPNEGFDIDFQSLSKRATARLEAQLRREWSGRQWFLPSDVTGTNIPGSGKYVNVKYDRKSMKVDATSLLAAYAYTLDTAPTFTWQFLEDINAPSLMAVGKDDPEVFEREASQEIATRKSNYRIQDEAIGGSTSLDYERYVTGTRLVDYHFGFCHSVGNVGFLEQQGGKLRTVANPNRFVQWVNIPLGEVLAKAFYRLDGVYTLNQSGGHAWCQSKLREGISLSSFDMSSATDRLDYKSFLRKFFKEVYETDDYPLLKRSFELFEDTSSAPWTIPGHICDMVGAHDNNISWTVGQPLGLRPSFPLLTIMNSMIAVRAIHNVDGRMTEGHFACVGDDLVIETRYAEEYMRIVRAFNGKINNEKTLTSDKYAEFCSQLVTRSTQYPLKPRWAYKVDGSLNNVERFSTEGLRPVVPKWAKSLHQRIASFSCDGFTHIPYRRTSAPRSLSERLGANVLMSISQPAERPVDTVTLESLVNRAFSSCGGNPLKAAIHDLSTSWADRAMSGFNPLLDDGELMVFDQRTRVTKMIVDPIEYLSAFTENQRTSVPVMVKSEWDYHSNRYVPSRAQISSAKKRARELDRMSFSQCEDLISVYRRGRSSGEPNIDLVLSRSHPHEAAITFSWKGQQVTRDVTDIVRGILNTKVSKETLAFFYPETGSADIPSISRESSVDLTR